MTPEAHSSMLITDALPYWLRLLAATKVLPASRLTDLTSESTQLVAILTTIVRNTRARKS